MARSGRLDNSVSIDASGVISACTDTLMDAAMVPQVPVLGTQEHGEPVSGGVLHCPALHQGVLDRPLRVAHDRTACVLEGGHLADLLAPQALGEGAGGYDPGLAPALARAGRLSGLQVERPSVSIPTPTADRQA